MNSFDFFWDLYNRKVGKKDAERAWNRLTLKKKDLACDGLEDRVANDRQWLAGYKPYPATFLNGERWNDNWERHVPIAQRPNNVRDTSHDIVPLKAKLAGLRRFITQLKENKQDTTELEAQVRELEAQYRLRSEAIG